MEAAVKRYWIDPPEDPWETEPGYVSRVTIREADNGEWVRYEDVLAEVKNAFFHAINEGFLVGPAYDDAWEQFVKDGFPRYE
jgi:hypothetical protein